MFRVGSGVSGRGIGGIDHDGGAQVPPSASAVEFSRASNVHHMRSRSDAVDVPSIEVKNAV